MHASSNYRKVPLDIKLDPFLNMHSLDGTENLFVKNWMKYKCTLKGNVFKTIYKQISLITVTKQTPNYNPYSLYNKNIGYSNRGGVRTWS